MPGCAAHHPSAAVFIRWLYYLDYHNHTTICAYAVYALLPCSSCVASYVAAYAAISSATILYRILLYIRIPISLHLCVACLLLFVTGGAGLLLMFSIAVCLPYNMPLADA
ncbi:hypothetical protein NPIL_692761 [Nephila pilipes]|uniref:Uncharacterized protein n=1 Tax=Nephila pilipes TaxID=299642 RepID=A0A8X6UFH9_NEPPI|nr:hypothetical protein NPIL_692761 [Nephila pilipes]